jgi:hypothetical protein
MIVLESCVLLGCYTASSGNFLPKIGDNLLVPSSGFESPKESLMPKYRVYIGKRCGW